MGAWKRLGAGRASLERQARAAVSAWRNGSCDGLFVTAGIPSSPREGAGRMVDFLRILRQELGFRGYVHAKAVVGCSTGQAESLLLLADRLSWTPEPRCSRALDEAPPFAASAVRVQLQGAGTFLHAIRRRCANGEPRRGASPGAKVREETPARPGPGHPPQLQLGLFELLGLPELSELFGRRERPAKAAA